MIKNIIITGVILSSVLIGYVVGVNYNKEEITIYTVNVGSIVNKAIDEAIKNKEEDIFNGKNADNLLKKCKLRIQSKKKNAKIILTQNKINEIEDITLELYNCMKELSEAELESEKQNKTENNKK